MGRRKEATNGTTRGTKNRKRRRKE